MRRACRVASVMLLVRDKGRCTDRRSFSQSAMRPRDSHYSPMPEFTGHVIIGERERTGSILKRLLAKSAIPARCAGCVICVWERSAAFRGSSHAVSNRRHAVLERRRPLWHRRRAVWGGRHAVWKGRHARLIAVRARLVTLRADLWFGGCAGKRISVFGRFDRLTWGIAWAKSP